MGPNFVKAGASLSLPAAPSHGGFRRETRSPEDGDMIRVGCMCYLNVGLNSLNVDASAISWLRCG